MILALVAQRVKIALLFTALFCLGSCAGSSIFGTEKAAHSRQNLLSLGSTSDDERSDLLALVAEAERVLASQVFADGITSFSDVFSEFYIRQNLKSLPVSLVPAVVRGEADGYRRIPAMVKLRGNFSRCKTSLCQNEYVATGSVGPTGYEEDLEINLGRHHLARWRSGNIVEKSCAVNTLVHEISHTVSVRDDNFTYAVIDDGKRHDKTLPLASYMTGSVAQCVWLQEMGRVPSDGLAACVKVFGTHNFNGNRCSQFATGQEVNITASRTGSSSLATPADPL